MGPYLEKRVFVDIIKIETGSPCVIWVGPKLNDNCLYKRWQRRRHRQKGGEAV